MAHDAVTREMLAPIVKGSDVALPRGWERKIDDGIQRGLLPFRSLVDDAGLRKALDKLAADRT